MTFSGDCAITNPLDVLKYLNIVYGIPNAVTLGLILGMLVAAIYIWSRNLTVLAILGIYSVAIVASTWAAEGAVTETYKTILYIIALSIASIVVMFVLKVLRE